VSHYHAGRMNYNFLGNDFHHLHAHLIPRYNPSHGIIEFAGMRIDDSKYWGKHFHTDKYFITTEAQKIAVRDALREAMSSGL
jgi:diadenosine tetraphosphate (Ap4A) HIT family hydrolase